MKVEIRPLRIRPLVPALGRWLRERGFRRVATVRCVNECDTGNARGSTVRAVVESTTLELRTLRGVEMRLAPLTPSLAPAMLNAILESGPALSRWMALYCVPESHGVVDEIGPGRDCGGCCVNRLLCTDSHTESHAGGLKHGDVVDVVTDSQDPISGDSVTGRVLDCA
jgi:hypothetical protein